MGEVIDNNKDQSEKNKANQPEAPKTKRRSLATKSTNQSSGQLEMITTKATSTSKYNVNEDGSVTQKRTRASSSSTLAHRVPTSTSRIKSEEPKVIYRERVVVKTIEKEFPAWLLILGIVVGGLLLLSVFNIGTGVWTKIIHGASIMIGCGLIIFCGVVLKEKFWD